MRDDGPARGAGLEQRRERVTGPGQVRAGLAGPADGGLANQQGHATEGRAGRARAGREPG